LSQQNPDERLTPASPLILDEEKRGKEKNRKKERERAKEKMRRAEWGKRGSGRSEVCSQRYMHSCLSDHDFTMDAMTMSMTILIEVTTRLVN
jgi:hypothetical protein